MRCEQCGLPDDRHTTECPVFQAAKAARRGSGDAKLAADLETWRLDQDAKTIIDSVCAKYNVANIGLLAPEVLEDLHEAIGVLMDESPPVTFAGDPRRSTP